MGMRSSCSTAWARRRRSPIRRPGNARRSPVRLIAAQAARQYSPLENTIKLRRLERLRQSRVTLVHGSACDGPALSRVLSWAYTHVVYLAVPSDGARDLLQRAN